MPAASPVNISDPTLRFTISVNGSPIQDYYPVVSIRVVHEVNKISHAEIVLEDGGVDVEDFPISDSSDFVPGNPIDITAGYGDDAEVSIFTGVIVKQSIRISDGSAYHLIVTCKHKAVTMTFNKTEAEFVNQKDSDIIQSIVSNYGLSATVTATSVVYESMFQKLATDWDFILSRADFCGYIVTFNGANMVIGKPELSGSPVLNITFGESVISFHGELNAEKQAPSLQASGWDIANQALLNSTASEPSVNSQGNLSGQTLSSSLQQKQLNLTSVTPMAQEELQTWANASLLRMRLAALKGRVAFIGNASVLPGNLIELAGVGTRFNGNAFVSAVTHTLEEGRWTTEVKFGLDNKPISEMPDFSYSPAVGQLPAIQGLQVATVKSIYQDPDSQYRISVNIPSNATAQDGMWARVSNFYATANAGAGFLPEVGDEVVVGFLENDPRYPVVLGSLYSSAKTAPNPATDNNNYIKSLTTKSQMKITFDDQNKIIVIETPAGNKITLSDQASSIEIQDQNSNSIKMSSGGIDIQSNSDINIKATGNINLNATGQLKLSAVQDANLSGMNVNATAQVGLAVKGNATAELSAAGQTSVKGGIVMIN